MKSLPQPLQMNPSRTLTESISFGKFTKECLAWEKWSAFTQNRYMEEVAQLTKTVSVAEKKAFFEAHYKNRAEIKLDKLHERSKAGHAVDRIRTDLSNLSPSVALVERALDHGAGEEKVTDVGHCIVNKEFAKNFEEIEMEQSFIKVEGQEHIEYEESKSKSKSLVADFLQEIHHEKMDVVTSPALEKKSTLNAEVCDKLKDFGTTKTFKRQLLVDTRPECRRIKAVEERFPLKESNKMENIFPPPGKRPQDTIGVSSTNKSCRLPKTSLNHASWNLSKADCTTNGDKSTRPPSQKMLPSKSVDMSSNLSSSLCEMNVPTHHRQNNTSNKALISFRASVHGQGRETSCPAGNKSMKPSILEKRKQKPTITSPFRFRSEERAAIRRQRLEKESIKLEVKNIPLERDILKSVNLHGTKCRSRLNKTTYHKSELHSTKVDSLPSQSLISVRKPLPLSLPSKTHEKRDKQQKIIKNNENVNNMVSKCTQLPSCLSTSSQRKKSNIK